VFKNLWCLLIIIWHISFFSKIIIIIYSSQPPKEKEPWDGIWDAGDFGQNCAAYEHNLAPVDRDPVVGHEDCLYLNIFSPNIARENRPLDVIFYIHGGAFMFGSGNYYGAKYLMDRNVIFVSINYRVGPFGNNLFLIARE